MHLSITVKAEIIYINIFRSFDQNGHHAYIWLNKISLNNKPELILTYFYIIKEIR